MAAIEEEDQMRQALPVEEELFEGGSSSMGSFSNDVFSDDIALYYRVCNEKVKRR